MNERYNRFLIFDTETTSLISNSLVADAHQPRIIEFYGCIVDREGTVQEELDFMCDPGFRIDETITRITGIKPDELKGKPPFRAYVEQVQALVSSAHVAVAHNFAYDWAVVNGEMARNGCSEVRWPMIRICTVEETEHLKGYRLSLTNLHEHLFGVPVANAHRARNDVQALTRCFVELMKLGVV